MPSLYTDSLYTSLLLGLYDRSTSLTEVQINCVESGEPPWKTSTGTVGMRFEDSTVLPFDYQLYLIRTVSRIFAYRRGREKSRGKT